MQYDFDEIIDRRGTGALKYEALLPRWGRDDLIPLWVADMDFKTPPFIMEAIRRRCEHEILGYTVKPRAFFDAIRNWVGRRHGWEVRASEIGFAPGIVPGISSAIQCFTEPGDKIMIQPPVYHPFAMIIRENGREIVNNPLLLENGRYRMDVDHMREAVRGCRMFILCNPHNPGGRVWSPEELRRVAEICAESGTLVVSDEIHADLALPGHRHTVFATVSEQARMNSVTYMAPSKAFNVPGLGSSYLICQNPALFGKYQSFVSGRELAEGHVFAYEGFISAYSGPEGEEWLKQALDYIQENIRYIDRELRREKITRRLKQRLDEGMVDEVRQLIEQGIAPDDLIYYGLEYKYLTLYVIGKLTYEEMFNGLEIAIHQFAKRQMTWFRGMERRGFNIHWVNATLPMEEKIAFVKEKLKEI